MDLRDGGQSSTQKYLNVAGTALQDAIGFHFLMGVNNSKKINKATKERWEMDILRYSYQKAVSFM